MSGPLPLSTNQLSLLDDNDLIHSPDRLGFFSIFRKYPDRKTSQRSYILSMFPEVLKIIGDDADCYISQGEFKKPNRRTVNLLRMGVCWADLDYYKDGHSFPSPQKMAYAFLLFCQDIGLPLPSLIIDSGQGAYAKWILSHTVPAAALPRWNAVQRLLLAKIQGFGADQSASDCSRVLRIVGTRHGKTGRKVVILWENPQLTYDFEDLAYEVLPLNREDYRDQWRSLNQKKITVKQQTLFDVRERQLRIDQRVVRKLFNPYTLNWNRLIDLRKLVQLKHWTSPPPGWQDKYLYLATCFLCWTVKQGRLYGEVQQLAHEFAPQWTIAEVRGVLSTTLRKAKEAAEGNFIEREGKLYDPRYRWSNKRLIEDLKITPEEQRHMLTIIGTEEKYRRKNEARRENRANMRREDYEANSLSKKKPWEQLGMSRAKWYRLGKPTE